MKNDESKIGFFRYLLRSLTENWGLKILSLLLAIIIYHSIKTDNGNESNRNDRGLFQKQ